ncbi:tetratricopeptide repeat protein [Echinicola salinicaeni]|uniref:tetratricopeptide repeat protein n=1 Tax=Echinicola salinicaeni TaxID=2762757 RepID=UPI00164788D0|nr:tetratricopeptide repeat protein [Echinicola salinicaeni]
MQFSKYLLIVLVFLTSVCYGGQVHSDSTGLKGKQEYLLLNKGLQFRITEAINSMYDFDFETAEKGFAVMRYNYPDHPLPYFLMGLSQWWKIIPDTESEQYDDLFFRFMDETIEKAEALLEEDPENKEASFFLAAAYGFKGRLLSERESWTATAFAGKNALKYMEMSKGEEELSPELLLGDALYNYFSVWIPENYPLLRPVMSLFPKGDKALGLRQLEEVAANSFYARVEAQYFLFRLYASEEKRPFDALQITDYLHNKYPHNPYFHRFYARQLYALGKELEAKEVSEEILAAIENGETGYESNSGRYAAFFIAQFYHKNNRLDEAKKYYIKTAEFGEESENQESGYYLYALLNLGKIYAKENNGEEAKEYLKKVKKYAKRKHPVHKEARDFLKKNKL